MRGSDTPFPATVAMYRPLRCSRTTVYDPFPRLVASLNLPAQPFLVRTGSVGIGEEAEAVLDHRGRMVTHLVDAAALRHGRQRPTVCRSIRQDQFQQLTDVGLGQDAPVPCPSRRKKRASPSNQLAQRRVSPPAPFCTSAANTFELDRL